MSWPIKLINLAVVFFGIGLCFYDALHGHGLTITLIVLSILIAHAAIVKDHAMELSIIVIAGVIGAIVECLNVSLGFYQYITAAEQVKFLPTWIILVWFLVGATARNAFGGVSTKFYITLISGLLFAISLYAAGAESGALVFKHTGLVSVVIPIVLWATAFTAIVNFSNRYFEVKLD